MDDSANPCSVCGRFSGLTESVYCNMCEKPHLMCTECIADNIDKFKIVTVSKSHMFAKNLEKWK